MTDILRNRVGPGSGEAARLHVGTPQRAAQTVNPSAFVRADTGASRIAHALAQLSPGLQRHMERKREQRVREEVAQAERAALEDNLTKKEVDKKIAKGELRPEQSPFYQQAYMQVMGSLAAKRKARELEELYANNFNPDTDDIDVFFQDNLGETLDGLDDLDYSKSFLETFVPLEQQLRDTHSAHVQARVKEDVQTAFGSLAQDFAVEIPNLSLEDQRDTLEGLYETGRTLNLSNQEVDELVFTAVNTIGNDGNPEVYEVFKKKRKNGTQGLFHNPNFKARIDTAQDTALRRQVTAAEAAEAAANANRAKWQENNFLQLVNMFNDQENPEVIGSQLNTLIAKGAIKASHASQVAGWVKTGRDKIDTERDSYANLLTFDRIYKGEITDVNDPMLTHIEDYAVYKQMVKEIEDRNQPDSIFKSSVYTESRSFILRSIAGSAETGGSGLSDITSILGADPSQRGTRAARALSHFNQRVAQFRDKHSNQYDDNEFREFAMKVRDEAVGLWKDTSNPEIQPNIQLPSGRFIANKPIAELLQDESLSDSEIIWLETNFGNN